MVALCFLLLLVATGACLAYLLPSLLARWSRRPHRTKATLTFAILIPAHNEEADLPITLASLAQIDYPQDSFRVYVVADNCDDRTAELASGTVCLFRNDPERRGKGYAIEFGLRPFWLMTPMSCWCSMPTAGSIRRLFGS